MKLTMILLTVGFLNVSAKCISQNVSFSGDQVPLRTVLASVKKQTGFLFVYSKSVLDNAKPVSINASNVPLEQFLHELFKEQALTFEFKGKNIFISAKPSAPSIFSSAKVPFFPIRGKILDDDGQPLVGASVTIKNTKSVGVTDAEGVFTLNVNEGDVIVVTFVGYQSKEIKVGSSMLNGGTLNITLSKVSAQLDEVVINKGYYTETKRLTTGSVGKITAEEISKQPVLNPLAALQGRVPGLVITQQTGVPGGGFRVSIRGTNSLRNSITDYQNGTNGNDPLYIIDGIPYFSRPQSMPSVSNSTGIFQLGTGANPLNLLNPADIESIEILKDADATSIYGSRGANGVILITTKQGKAGKMQLDINFYTGAGKVTRKMKLLNTEQYLEMRKEGFSNDNVTTYPANAYDVNGTWDAQRYTDWQKELIGGTAVTTDGQLAVSGGTVNTKYRINSGYHRETAVFPGDFSSQRATVAFTLNNRSLNQRLKSDLSVNYSYGLSNLLTNDLTSQAVKLAPNAPALYNNNGNLNFENGTFTNPLVYTRRPYDSKSYALISNFSIGYELFARLNFDVNFGYTNTFTDQLTKNPISSQDPNLPAASKVNRATFFNATNNSWTIDPKLSYTNHFGSDHTLSAFVGTSLQREKNKSLNQSASGFISESLMDNVSAVPAANVTNTFNESLYKYNAVFGRINYDYRHKYIINLTGRRDGSSRFGPGRQFANFGSIGAAWIFSEENLIKQQLPFLSFGKLRASYGTTGNDQISNYGFMDTYTTASAGQYQNSVGLRPSQLFNPDYSWEINKKMDAEIELGFLQDRIRFAATYYRNRCSNQLVGYPLPSNTGFTTVQFNLPAVVQNNGWEFMVNTINIKSSAVKWNSSFNISIPRNKLIAYPNIEGSSYAAIYEIGEPINSIIRLYRYTGVNKQTGLYEVTDVDNNGILNAADKYAKFFGTTMHGGLANSISYKSFQLDFLLQFVKQSAYNYIISYGMPGQMGNFPVEVMNRWKKADDVADIQEFSASAAILPWFNYIQSDATVTDASYIRLKNLSLSYAVKGGKGKSQQLRIYLRAQNLFTITNYRGLDPETQGTTLPPLRLLTAGIQFNL